MRKLDEHKKKITLTIGTEEYKKLARFAEREERNIASAVRIIVLQYIRNM